MRYKVIDRWIWRHRDGRTASVYGAVPGQGYGDGWQRVRIGYTIQDSKTMEIGRAYALTTVDPTDRAGVQGIADRLNARERRFYTYTEDDERVWLDATTLDDAITEVSESDHTRLGQIADVYDSYEYGNEVAAVSVDVLG